MVKSTGIIRKVDEMGRFVLPSESRQKFNIEEQDGLELFEDVENGQIILQKPVKTCLKCRSTENLKEIKPFCYISDNCIKNPK